MRFFIVSFFLILPQWIRAAPPVDVKNTGTYPELRVEGKPFFIHAAHFPYPRLPRDLWESSLEDYKAMGINTIDLYIPWNWHESSSGQLDFDGHTNPRKDLIGLLRIISKLGLRAIARPGPYICAEWKNGGYPDWLLESSEYKMAARSILEGRYPPLSSLQYTDPEMAAKGWLENTVHRRYLERWYYDVASNILNVHSIENGGPIILVQLDDDQPAGLRADGPYFWEYMKTLRNLFLDNGVSLPMILNPEETSVPSLGDRAVGRPHLWIMSQWYQRNYGLDLSTSSLIPLESLVQSMKMSPEFPPSVVEFNAGFFAVEDDPYGMQTNPSDTLIASRVLLQNGLKGIVYFPLQDSLYPTGYEIPLTNPYYTWESALDVSGKRGPKARSVQRNGNLVRTYGDLLASSHEWGDVGVINELHAMDFVHSSTTAIAAVENALKDLERNLIEKQITSDWVDPQAQPVEQLLRYPVLIQPYASGENALPPLSSPAQDKLQDYVTRGGRLIRLDPASSEKEQLLTQLAADAKFKSSRWVYGSEIVSNHGLQQFGRHGRREEFLRFGRIVADGVPGARLVFNLHHDDRVPGVRRLQVPHERAEGVDVRRERGRRVRRR